MAVDETSGAHFDLEALCVGQNGMPVPAELATLLGPRDGYEENVLQSLAQAKKFFQRSKPKQPTYQVLSSPGAKGALALIKKKLFVNVCNVQYNNGQLEEKRIMEAQKKEGLAAPVIPNPITAF